MKTVSNRRIWVLSIVLLCALSVSSLSLYVLGSSSSLLSSSTSSALSVAAKTFNALDNVQTVFYWSDTVRVGANVTPEFESAKVIVTILDPSGKVMVKNASMSYIWMEAYNYRYDYKLQGSVVGSYGFTVYVQDTGGSWVKASGSFVVHGVYTTSNGWPWSVTTGRHYNSTFTVRAYGAQAYPTLYADVPSWHAVAFVMVNGVSSSFTTTSSSYSGYRRVSVSLGLVKKDAAVQVKFVIVVEVTAEIGTKALYYRSTWKTAEGFYYSEKAKTAIVNVAGLSEPVMAPYSGNILIFSWDGVEREVFYELLSKGNLSFVSNLNIWNMTDNLEINGTLTQTRPQHASMFSGYLANVTGILTNEPKKSLPAGYSVFERVKGLKPDYYIVGGTAKPTNVGDMLGFMAQGTYYNKNGFDRFENRWGLIEKYPPLMNGDDSFDERLLAAALNSPPFLYMFHFTDPDDVGHKYGVNSIQYRQAIINSDKATASIYYKLASSNPIIIITSDHGFGKPTFYNHKEAPNTFIASNIKLRNAYEVDVAPTIYEILEIDTNQFTPKLNGKSLISSPTISSPTHPDQESWYSDNNPSFSWTAPADVSGIAGYSYVLDHSPSTFPDKIVDTVYNSESFIDLSDGTWYFHVRAEDNYGNWGPPGHYRVQIDTTQPWGSIIINDGAIYSSSPNVMLALSAADTTSGVVEMRFSDDGSAWSLWEPFGSLKSWVLPGGDGLNTVYVQFKDNAGLISSPYSDDIILDTTLPSVQITNPTDSSPIYIRSGTTITVNYTYTELNPMNATIKVYNATHVIGEIVVTDLIPGVDVARSDSFTMATWAADGEYNVTVTIGDMSDRTGTDTKTNALIIDNTPPIINITYPSEAQYIDSVSIIWINGTVIEKNWDGKYPIINDTQFERIFWNGTHFAFWNATTISDSTRSYTISFTDLAGNTGNNTVTFTIDTIYPVVEISYPTDGQYLDGFEVIWINGTFVEKNFDHTLLAINDTRFELVGYTWNSSTYEGAFAFRNSSTIPDGAYFVRVSLTDKAGKTGFDIVYFTIDTIAPIVNITYPTDGEYIDAGPIVWINGTFKEKNFNTTKLLNINRTEFALASWTWDCTTSEGTFAFWNITAVSDGTYYIEVSITDLAGKTGFSTVRFTVDTVAPVVDIEYPANAQYMNISTIWINGTITELNVGSLEPQINNTAFSLIAWDPLTGAFAFKNNTFLSDGTIYLTVNFTDLAGKTGSDTVSFFLDATLPTVSINHPTEGSYLNVPLVWVNGTVTELNKGGLMPFINDTRFDLAYWDVDTGNFAFSNNTTIPDGLISVEVRFADLARNIGSKSVMFILDTASPIVTITYPRDGAPVSEATIYINGTITELNKGTMEPFINDTRFSLVLWDPTTGAFAFQNTTNIPSDTISLTISFIDLAGNTGNATVSFIVGSDVLMVEMVNPAKDEISSSFGNCSIFLYVKPTRELIM